MGTEQIDYGLVLSDMENKRAALDAAISNIRMFLAGRAGTESAPPGTATSPTSSGEIPAGAFLGRSIPEGAVLYLEIVKRKATSREISEALKRGGMESTSSNFPGIVHACLDRYRKAGGEIVKLDKSTWGLARWYPAGVRSVAQEKRAPTKKQSKPKSKPKGKSARPPIKKRPEQTEPVEVPTATKSGPGAQARILAYFDSHLDQDVLAPDLAKALEISVSVANLICAKLAHLGKIEKTPEGGYRSRNPIAA
jgi:hypothetical protein